MLQTHLLDSYLGTTISQICTHGYAKATDNHCAHFVSHVLRLSFGCTCALLGSGPKGLQQGANVRVAEVFDRSPGVYEFTSCPNVIQGLVFVSAPKNFETISSDGMVYLKNVKKKHIGIILNGMIWHYSNSKDKVVKQTIGEFIRHYPKQDNALWYGEFPAGAKPISYGICAP